LIDLGIISGSGFYNFPGLHEESELIVPTKFGDADVATGVLHGKKLAFISRHGSNHERLPHMINYRANMLALHVLDARAVIGTTICGVLDPNIPLGKLAVFDDLFFPENRLPDGQPCTVYTDKGQKKRGHYIFDKPFNQTLRKQIIRAAPDSLTEAVYAHVNGPRFNSRSEVRSLRSHATYLSQTAGPEVVMAGELEIPHVLLGYGVDYANGVGKEPTPVETLRRNLEKSKDVFLDVIRGILKQYEIPEFEGFVYRFD
jgi:5'-methylthioadenosine phosphorylase